MNTSRKAMECLICFSIVNLMLGCLSFKKFKKFNESLLKDSFKMTTCFTNKAGN